MMNYQNNRYFNNYTTNTYSANNHNPVPPTESPSYLGFLNTLVKENHVILLDTCTILKGEPFERLLQNLITILQRHGKQITVLQSVMEELRAISTGPDSVKRAKALRALECLRLLQINNVVVLRGSPNTESSGGEGIIKYVSKNIYDKNICVLTQSGDLAADCALFQQIRSCPMPYTVTVKRISNLYGQLNNFDPAAPRVEAPRAKSDASYTNLYKTLGL